ncbi:MAG: hypothetical protein EOP04_30395, partial [Proteobacteria bacterium]
MKTIQTLVVIPAFFLLAACHENVARSEGVPVSEIDLGPGVVDGNKLTLGFLSDALDDGLTIESVKSILGQEPHIVVDNHMTELKYAVSTNDIYENGIRITSVTIVFKDGVLADASVDFTGYV